MIAIFINQAAHGLSLGISRYTKYKVINNVEDTRGIEFTDIITVGDWYNTSAKLAAFEALKKRQPDLFK